MDIQLLFDRVIVMPLEDVEIEMLGIRMPANSGSNRGHGIVKHVGTEMKTSIKPGDKVLYNKTQVDEVYVGEDLMQIMVERNIDAII